MGSGGKADNFSPMQIAEILSHSVKTPYDRLFWTDKRKRIEETPEIPEIPSRPGTATEVHQTVNDLVISIVISLKLPQRESTHPYMSQPAMYDGINSDGRAQDDNKAEDDAYVSGLLNTSERKPS